MKRNAFIFIGRSGSGKGTQAKLLKEHMEFSGKKVAYIETGAHFRAFIKGKGYSQDLSRKIMDEGHLQPEFLAIWLWAKALIDELEGDEDVIIDGSPRVLDEAHVLDTALNFYGLTPHVIYLNISHDEAVKRLIARGREDDTEGDGIEERQKWFTEQVVPAIEYYRDHARYNLLDIDGNHTVEEIQRTLKEKLEA